MTACAQENGRIYLVMEYCSGGDLAAFIRQRRSVAEAEARALMQQLAAGLHELWSRNLVHVRAARPCPPWGARPRPRRPSACTLPPAALVPWCLPRELGGPADRLRLRPTSAGPPVRPGDASPPPVPIMSSPVPLTTRRRRLRGGAAVQRGLTRCAGGRRARSAT